MVSLTAGDEISTYVDEALAQGEVVDLCDGREELPEERNLGQTHGGYKPHDLGE